MADADVTAPLDGVRIRVDKTGSAVHAALDADQRAAFEAEFRAALAHVDDQFDLDAVQNVVERWWPAAVLCANPEIRQGANPEIRQVIDVDDHHRLADGVRTVSGDPIG
ncbi:DUF6247 family protein [Protofrankia symbiont of Coriaria ruscifolia]|uniref:DUF6247 family protein n=1 Tax=Protofrankia symbiont of Coriaria ruscifolia TaxID=1306542 RepID=UPI001041B89C|nr:DUF6247 family protein [Protofrankia symbiont of Coriaria ruscifolia]